MRGKREAHKERGRTQCMKRGTHTHTHTHTHTRERERERHPQREKGIQTEREGGDRPRVSDYAVGYAVESVTGSDGSVRGGLRRARQPFMNGGQFGFN